MDADFPAGLVECVEEFLASDTERPPGLDLYEDCFKSPLFFPLQRREELRRMIQIARAINPVTVMEIGTDKGAGVYHWAKCLPSVRHVIAAEVRGTPYWQAFESAFKRTEFTWIRGSRAAIDRMVVEKQLKRHERLIDALFIDGDKNAFLEDFDAYLPLMNPRGVIFMHDVNEPGRPMLAAFEAVKVRGYRTETIIDITDSLAARRRELAGLPPANPHEAWLRHWAGRSCGVGVIYLDRGKI